MHVPHIVLRQPGSQLDPFGRIRKWQQNSQVGIGKFTVGIVSVQLYQNFVGGDFLDVFLYRRTVRHRTFALHYLFQIQDRGVQRELVGIESGVAQVIGLIDLCAVGFIPVGDGIGTGKLVQVHRVAQHVKSGDTVGGAAAHAQAAFHQRRRFVGSADDAAVAFAGRRFDLHAGHTAANTAALVPSGDAAHPCTQRGIVIAAGELAGHKAVSNFTAGTQFAYKTAH